MRPGYCLATECWLPHSFPGWPQRRNTPMWPASTSGVERHKDETRVLSDHRVLAVRSDFPHHHSDSKERRTPLHGQLAPWVLTGHNGTSRDAATVLSDYMDLAGCMKCPDHQGNSRERIWLFCSHLAQQVLTIQIGKKRRGGGYGLEGGVGVGVGGKVEEVRA